MADEYCLLGVQHWSTCMTKAEWSGWMQAIFSVVAILAAFVIPLVLDRRAQARARLGHLEAVATDVRITERQARVYVRPDTPKMPAYRMPLYGTRIALPALLAEGRLSGAQAGALVQYYVDATSFNMLLDEIREHHNAGHPINKDAALDTAMVKAGHLQKGSHDSRYDDVIEALRQAGLPPEALQEIPLDIRRELGADPDASAR